MIFTHGSPFLLKINWFYKLQSRVGVQKWHKLHEVVNLNGKKMDPNSKFQVLVVIVEPQKNIWINIMIIIICAFQLDDKLYFKWFYEWTLDNK